MNITIGSEGKCLKQGTGKRGPWALYAIADTNGNQYKTWDSTLGLEPAGTTVDVDLKVEPGKDGYPPQTFVTRAKPKPRSAGPSAPPKDSRDAAAIRRAVAFKGAIDVTVALVATGDRPAIEQFQSMVNVYDRILAGERVGNHRQGREDRGPVDEPPYDEPSMPEDASQDPRDNGGPDDNLPF